MALIKEIKTSNGQVTTYHKIGLFNINTYTNTIDINLAGYTSAEYRELEKTEAVKNGENIVTSTAIQIPYDGADISIPTIYEAIKQLEGWQDAIDG